MTMEADSGFATERPPVPEMGPPPLEDGSGLESRLEPTIRVRDLHVASLAYKEFCDRQAQGRADNVDAWCASQPGPPEQAQLYRDLHRSNPTAASRLADAIIRMPD